jgi:hypothetical protein
VQRKGALFCFSQVLVNNKQRIMRRINFDSMKDMLLWAGATRDGLGTGRHRFGKLERFRARSTSNCPRLPPFCREDLVYREDTGHSFFHSASSCTVLPNRLAEYT